MSGNAQYLTLAVDRERFGIAIAQVREILDMQPICRLPHAPAFVLGMIDVRGTSFPVVDLRTKFGLPRIERTESIRIIIADVQLPGRTLGVGFVADRVDEVTSLASETLERPPEVGVGWDRPCIAGIGRKDGEFVIVLDLSALMAADDAALTAGFATARAAA